MAKTAHTHLAVACLAGLAGMAAPAWSGPLDTNRALIVTDNAFTADKTILDQACLMIELNYRMDEDEGLVFDPEAPEVVLGRVPLRNLSAKSAEDSLARAREGFRMRACALAVAPETEWDEEQKALRKRFPQSWSQGEIAVSAQRLAARRGMRKGFRSSLEASLPYLAMMDSVFRAEGLPARLKYLPHVESRFNPEAVSPAGQAGAFGPVSRAYYAMFLAASSLAMQADKLYPGLRKLGAPSPAWKSLRLEHEWTPRQLRLLSGYSTAVLMRYNPALRPVVFEKNLPLPRGFDLRLPVGLPSRQDLQFADLRIAGNGGDELRGKPGVAGLPVPKFAESALLRVRQALFAGGRRDDQPVMAYMHSQGLLDADRLALAKADRILIEPHPALQAMLRGTGG